MFTMKRLTQKEKELVAVAASIASGCLPCTMQHIKLACEIGAFESEVLRSIFIASDVRDNATEIMAEAAQGNPVNEYPIRMQSGSMEGPIDDLISMGAALASNSVTGLEYFLTRAKAAGAATRQIQTVAGIARAIREEAEEEADAIIKNLIEPIPVETDDQLGDYYQQAVSRFSKQTNEDVTTVTEEQQESDPPTCGCS
jgi:AhpD family alkylhydroperoxidase